uniref:C4b-binding protein alpha chain-like isoform X1 n=1 Tax=Podarcis muralis TaxID=64176 RepID=UPI00109EF73C|nr:C4b-binding protein alpha chain-like isoform X1 [Podarcis muralis]XP_028590242.1 C4b-binding protein alpha chain-like isoform X1 [Podarcis muralis]XP_028590243.1 C4b-binding protein alpha chain-like isoform X1 [Podarcis muralis]
MRNEGLSAPPPQLSVMLRLLWGLLRTCRLLAMSMLLLLLPQELVGDRKWCKIEELPVFSFSEIIHELPGNAVYECKNGFTRLPSKPNTTYCIDGNWTPLEDPCGEVCPFPPKQTRAKLKDEFGTSVLFPVGMVVHYVCKAGFEQVPGILNTITCGKNMKWSPLARFCRGKTCETPTLVNGGSILSFNSEYTFGARILYMCIQGYTMIGRRWNTCEANGSDVRWSNPPPLCVRAVCKDPPDIPGGSHNGTASIYPYGTVIKYSCKETFSLIGEPIIYCDVDKTNRPLWSSKPPKCQVIICTDPVVQDGMKKISEFKDSYTFGGNITFECKIGYFMIGSYFIRCEANNTWIPKVPSCKKVSQDICGAPVILKGSVYPPQPYYNLGSIISVRCDKKYSFPDETMEMKARCKGYNQWDPPVQLCFCMYKASSVVLRLSPDTAKLHILNGIIKQGKKEYYYPGDEVIIECYAGYVLKGSSKIKYIGGEKWLPNIPHCYLSIFLRVLIAGCLLPVLIVGTKMVYQKFYLERARTESREMRQSTTATKEHSLLPKSKVAVASPNLLSNDLSSETSKRIAVQGKLGHPRNFRSKSVY